MKKGARNCSKAAAPLLSAGPIRVTGMDAGGAGLIRLPDGLEVIVPGARPGDEITLAYRPPQPGGRRGLAESFETLAASPDRAHDRCALAGDCGGCPMARLNYSKELELKRDLLVVEPLRAQGLLDAENASVVEAAVGLPEEKLRGFRNKAVLYPGILDGACACGRVPPDAEVDGRCRPDASAISYRSRIRPLERTHGRRDFENPDSARSPGNGRTDGRARGEKACG